ncbi:MAG TPA: YbaL family putative K(+) efflux transporter [Gammaproteobacteria bacterium]
MPHSVPLISTIAAAFAFALVLGFIAVRLKLPALVGYLLAGIVIGPHTPGFAADVGLSQQLAEIGVILLMFGVGLHFSLKELLTVRKIAVPGAVLQITTATLLGMLAAWMWGWSLASGIVFGLALSVASTVVLLRELANRHLLGSVDGRVAVGWLLVEDLAMVLALVLLPPLAAWLAGGAEGAAVADTSLLLTLALTLGKVALFAALMLVVGKRLLPWMLWEVGRTGSRELFTLGVLAAALGIAFGAAKLFGVSFALGAFFTGMVMRESALSRRAASESLPLRDAFSVLFFVSVGMLFDPTVLLDEPLRVLLVVLIIVLGKSIAAGIIVLAFRYPLHTALTVSASLAQIGEFSFILAGLGMSLGILPQEGLNLILAGAVISIALNPLLFFVIGPLQSWLKPRSKLARSLSQWEDPLAELPMSVPQENLTGHVVLVGYGRLGSSIADALIARGIPLVTVERNREMVEQLRARGIAAVAGDASEPAVLIQAHIARAQQLVIATPDHLAARKMVEIAHTLKPDVEVLLRSHDDAEAELLRKENLGEVFTEDHVMAVAMTAHVLAQVAGESEPH